MSSDHSPPPHRPGTDPADDVAPDRRSGLAGLLWILLLAALAAIGIWWYAQRATDAPTPAPPLLEVPVPVPVVEAPDTSPSPAPAASPEAPIAAPPAQVVRSPQARDRDPTPLPGNLNPRYPAQALRAGVQGSVSVRIEVDARGVPTEVRVVGRSGERSRDLDRAVLAAARRWRFEPALRNGEPVPGAVVLPVDFRRD